MALKVQFIVSSCSSVQFREVRGQATKLRSQFTQGYLTLTSQERFHLCGNISQCEVKCRKKMPVDLIDSQIFLLK